jgi:hypothetical protein
MLKRIYIFILITALTGILAACSVSPATTPVSSPSPSPSPQPSPSVVYTRYQLEYLLFARFPDVFWIDPDLYPISRGPGQEMANALQQFPDIQAKGEEFAAILEHLNLPNKSGYSDAEKLGIYREYKKLNRGATLNPSGNLYDFSIRTGENQGLHYMGTITTSGRITITNQEPSFNTYPICLSLGALIDTISGPLPVENIQPGMMVWTLDSSGNRIMAPVVKTSSTPVPALFQVVKITLCDGRTITASPGHPSSIWRLLGDYRPGDMLDGSPVIKVERLAYEGDHTYDLLPAGGTGVYRANGVMLGSTLFVN